MSATLDPTTHSGEPHDDHGHGDSHGHGHNPFLAHHFDDPEQQFDSGKLGMWLFLVTEVLFFSGMFCAYALYRSLHPEVFEFASRFLNEKLGAFNTGVLLFSSLTMAWGVRCAQLRQRTGLVVCLAMTLGCASIFLGVKAIEYSHKWDIGLLPAGLYLPQYLHLTEHHEGLSDWLIRFCIIPGLCVIGFGIWYVIALAKGDKARAEIAGPFLATALCFFVGVGIGMYFQAQEDAELAAAAAASHGEAGAHASDHAHDVADAQALAADQSAHGEPAKPAHMETHSIASKDFQPGEAPMRMWIKKAELVCSSVFTTA